MTNEYIFKTAETIRDQLFNLTDLNVIFSWGIQPPLTAAIIDGMPALKFQVNGRLHKGLVAIALNEGVDYYEIFLQKQGESPVKIAEEVDFTQLGQVIDEAIETGTDKAEYEAFCLEEKKKLFSI